jgi:hypothetical protein
MTAVTSAPSVFSLPPLRDVIWARSCICLINAVLDALGKNERTRLAAGRLEQMGEHDRRQSLRRLLRRIDVTDLQISVTIDPSALDQTDRIAGLDDGDGLRTIELPFDIVRRDNGARVLATGAAMSAIDSSASALVKAVARGYAWRQQLLNGSARSTAEIAQKEGVTRRYVVRLLRLGFLAPDIIASILVHRQPRQVLVDFLARLAQLPLNRDVGCLDLRIGWRLRVVQDRFESRHGLVAEGLDSVQERDLFRRELWATGRVAAVTELAVDASRRG